MTEYKDKQFDEERALYGSNGVLVENCRFDGPLDGESALKESSNIVVRDSFFNLRYPFWHDSDLTVSGSRMTETCRAALWYSDNIRISDTELHGIKALRECRDVEIKNCDIISPEFGWFNHDVKMEDSSAESEYFMMRSERLDFSKVKLKGKYSFQYISNSVFTDCEFDTKDAFWHASNVVVKNSIVKGEYLAWYCDNVTFENCLISGTQPLCYCSNLRLINCRMENTDLSFEKSDVDAVVLTEIDSVKNPRSGRIKAPSIGKLIMDDPQARCAIL
ncbi:MAG: DUF3737 family protein [Lachnospiraceae bacterium]|nr:DUF3737 family protein [Lachnospiraceae bacterium]